ncbi:hypothetical protein [Sphingobacterium zeae]|uniref:hypothetical protein n=1 Tax=Sphingobacterium zeae TaxID=1776859 RepID=UPI00360F957D
MKPNWEEIFVTLLKKPVKTDEEFSAMQYARAEFEKELNLEMQALMREIELKGLKINSIWDLVNMKSSYPDIIDILKKHLSRKYHNKNKEGIIRALGVKDTDIDIVSTLLKEYRLASDKGIKDAIILTIYNILRSKTAKQLSKAKNEDEEVLKKLLDVFSQSQKISINEFVKFFKGNLVYHEQNYKK